MTEHQDWIVMAWAVTIIIQWEIHHLGKRLRGIEDQLRDIAESLRRMR